MTKSRKNLEVRPKPGKIQKKGPPAPLPPPKEWPEYGSGPLTVEGVRDVERRQKEYVAYYGDFPYNPETYWRQLEEAESSECESGSEEGEGKEVEGRDGGGEEVEEAGHTNEPESLDDDEILRAIEYALSVARARRANGEPVFQAPSFAHPVQQPCEVDPRGHQALSTSSPAAPMSTPSDSASSTVVLPLASQVSGPANPGLANAMLVPPSSAQAVGRGNNDNLPRLRPKSVLRLTQRARKLYRL
ncbi:hypothetical protein FA13DRAFT_1713697 [Coprinellus micaceus]|uniref:Uncharacterized protein n=1 Tax=Coprinellus micaceus TaxID=71717 RepID=A0A4Y7SVF3_COPMI|nr:hypothetical protein FA13DRAFT_1713697 [Coprinellus micaceus]